MKIVVIALNLALAMPIPHFRSVFESSVICVPVLGLLSFFCYKGGVVGIAQAVDIDSIYCGDF